LKLGVEQCPGADHVFPGAKPGKPLTARLIERMVRRTGQAAGIGKDVTCMILRHSYGVDCLRQGMSPPQLQENLGHRSIATTLDYRRCLLPDEIISPADSLQTPPIRSPNRILPNQEPRTTNSELSSSTKNQEPRTPNSSFATPPLPLLSFPFPTIPSSPRQFFSMLKTCIGRRFLGLRSFIKDTS
jgi:hypothetical protein